MCYVQRDRFESSSWPTSQSRALRTTFKKICDVRARTYYLKNRSASASQLVSVYRLDRFTRPVGLVVHGTLATRRPVKNLFRELLDLD